MGNIKVRSLSERENYATYFALPFLKLSKYSFGDGNFINGYITINGRIGALVRNINEIGWAFERHKYYVTDIPYYDGYLILFKCPSELEKDMLCLLESKYSQFSDQAKALIKEYSGLHVDFWQKDGSLFTSRLYSQAIRKDSGWKSILEERLGIRLPDNAELEPELREQDILYDVDTDISFIYQEYNEKR